MQIIANTARFGITLYPWVRSLRGLLLRTYAYSAKKLLQAAQKRPGEAREKSTSGGVLRVRCSEAIERNEAYGPFSAACQGLLKAKVYAR
jgi:hypothetical protein